jgi:hypothetical protein
MSVIYALEATDGTRGYLVDAFGVYADPGVSSIVQRIPMERVAASDSSWHPWRVVAIVTAVMAIGVGLSWRRRG